MKTKIHVIAVLMVLLLTIATTSQAHSLSPNHQQFSGLTSYSIPQKSGLGPLLDGPGPMCPPTHGCGNGNYADDLKHISH